MSKPIESKRTIEPQWLKVLEDLNVKMKAKKKQCFLLNSRNEPADLDKLPNESVEWHELTAIASTKNRSALEDLCSISYEEDEDCDGDAIELDLRRSGNNKFWEFEVNPLGRSHLRWL